MSTWATIYVWFRRCVAFAGGALAVSVAVSMCASGACVDGTVSEALNADVGLLVAVGWLVPIFSLCVLICSFYKLVLSLIKPEGGARRAAEAGFVGLGALVLMFTTSWAYMAFGYCRMGGNPSWGELWLTLSFLTGASGLLLLRRWGALMICAAGWSWLAHLVAVRAAVPGGSSPSGIALLLTLLTLPMTSFVIAFRRYLR